jgi:hypothetical protein
MSGESKNSMIVYLNQEGLNTLFPEGTPARIQLGESVLAKAIGTHVKGLLVPDVIAEISKQVREASKLVNVEALIRENFNRTSWYEPQKLIAGSKLDVSIKIAVENAFSSAIIEVVEKAVLAKVEALTSDIERRVSYEVEKRLSGITNDMVKARVNEALAKIQLA